MKRFFAAFAVLWYLVSITGLDIHRDIEHSKTYVVPGIIAQSCELIHPREHCHDHSGCGCGSCCSHKGCEEDENCCTDDFGVVSITGTDPGNQSFQQFQPTVSAAVFFDADKKAENPCFIDRTYAKGPPRGPSDINIRLCVMRA